MKNKKLSSILVILAVLIMVSISTLLSGCFNSSGGGLNNILLSGSGGSSFNQAVPFDDISDDPGVNIISTLNGSDDASDQLSGALPFDFKFFTQTFNAGNDVVVCTNGFLSFDPDAINFDQDQYNYNNVSQLDEVLVGGSHGPYNSFIAPFWDDLFIRTSAEGHRVWYITKGSSPNRQFIVQWFGDGFDESDNQLIFQAILFEGTNDIQFSYGWMKDVNNNDQDGDDGSINGSSATIGIMAGQDQLSYPQTKIFSINSPSIPPIPANQAFYIYFKATDSNASNYQIYEGFVPATLALNPRVYNPNPNYNITNDKPQEQSNFRWFYKTNTPEEFWNFINLNRR